LLDEGRQLDDGLGSRFETISRPFLFLQSSSRLIRITTHITKRHLHPAQEERELLVVRQPQAASNPFIYVRGNRTSGD
jgi:hypothetical protein